MISNTGGTLLLSLIERGRRVSPKRQPGSVLDGGVCCLVKDDPSAEIVIDLNQASGSRADQDFLRTILVAEGDYSLQGLARGAPTRMVAVPRPSSAWCGVPLTKRAAEMCRCRLLCSTFKDREEPSESRALATSGTG